MAGSLGGDSVSQSQPAQSSQKQTLQEPSTSGTQGADNVQVKSGPGPKSPQGPSKHQRLSRGTPGGGQAKRPRTTGQLGCATTAQEGIRMAIVCEGYPEAQVSKDNFINIQRAISRLVDELPEEGFTPRLVDMFWTKGAAIVVCQDEETREWLAGHIP